jgi:sec-independent protein translocase protein TatA
MFRRTMNMLASFMNLGGPDLLIILLIVLVLFGAKKLPELARGLGQAIKEFQKAKDEFSDELHKAGNTDATAKTTPPQSTVPQSPATSAQPAPNQAVNPGSQADRASPYHSLFSSRRGKTRLTRAPVYDNFAPP